MAKKKIQPTCVEVQRFERCPVEGCDVREWHRHETKEEGTPNASRVVGYGKAQLLEDELPADAEPEIEPPPFED